MKILHILSTYKTKKVSASAEIAQEFIAKLKQQTSEISIDVLDLSDHPYNKLVFPSDFTKPSFLEAVKQFKTYRHFIFSFGLYNFTIPALLKNYLDRIMIKTETFSYDELGNFNCYFNDLKTSAILFCARGNIYHNTPKMGMLHDTSLVETCLKFIGIKNIQNLAIEGTQILDKNQQPVYSLEKFISNNQQKLTDMAATFVKP